MCFWNSWSPPRALLGEANPERKTTSLGLVFFYQSVFLLCPMCVCLCESSEGKNGCERGGKMQSSACLSGHTIQRREKPFIQHSLPTPPSKLPSNSLWPEWTRWHGSTALTSHRNTHTHAHTLCLSSPASYILILSIILSPLSICPLLVVLEPPLSLSACHPLQLCPYHTLWRSESRCWDPTAFKSFSHFTLPMRCFRQTFCPLYWPLHSSKYTAY